MRRLLKSLALAGTVFLTILLIAGALYERFATWRDERKYPPPGRLVDVGTHRLHLLCQGEGSPTVVLELGLGGSLLSRKLVQDYPCGLGSGLRVRSSGLRLERSGPGAEDGGPARR